MEKQTQDLIKKAYFAFNARDIDMALSTMHPNVQWPKAFEGGYVNGHPEIRKYWTRQWTEINPNVEPVEFNERQDGTLEIMVHQIVKDLVGKIHFANFLLCLRLKRNQLCGMQLHSKHRP